MLLSDNNNNKILERNNCQQSSEVRIQQQEQKVFKRKKIQQQQLRIIQRQGLQNRTFYGSFGTTVLSSSNHSRFLFSVVMMVFIKLCTRNCNSIHAWSTHRLTYNSKRFYQSTLKQQQSLWLQRHVRYLSAAFSDNNNDNEEEQTQRKIGKGNKKKFIINKNISQSNVDKLAAAFDDLARKEGFDSNTSYFANDKTFEDEFNDKDYDEFFKEGNIDDDDDNDYEDNDDDDNDVDISLDSLKFDISDFDENITRRRKKDNGIDDNNEISFDIDQDAIDDMDARIAAAQRDIGAGRITVPKDMDDTFNENLAASLGFRVEENPFGNGETSRNQKTKNTMQLITDAMVCSACGADFQCNNEHRPGYIPQEKYAIQVKLNRIEELQKLQQKAELQDDQEWTTEDEIEWLIQSAGTNNVNKQDNDDDINSGLIDIPAEAEKMGLDLEALAKKKVICKRCHGLQNFGKVDEALRPGWTEEPLLSQTRFRELLRPIREKPAVIIALVDLFDFSGSVLPELDNIAGDNPVILAANKADLLPSKMGKVRAENWVRRELEYLGIKSLANVGGSVRLISCKTGVGVNSMLSKARSLAEELDGDIYVVGAANAGKSTLLNHILAHNSDKNNENNDNVKTERLRAGNRNKRKGYVTTSPLPGTTLKFIKVDLGEGRALYDTPGLLVNGTLTQLLTPEELKIVVPKSQVEPVTFRLASGKAVLVGGLAKVELVGDCKPFLFTFYVANAVKLHPTDSSKADEFVQKHAGEMLTPPLPPGDKRMEQIGEFESHELVVDGSGWKEAAADISLTGLGWVAVTGPGKAIVRVSVPKGIVVELRPPLMPFDIWETTARYTGAKAVRKTKKTKYGKRRKGVGRN